MKKLLLIALFFQVSVFPMIAQQDIGEKGFSFQGYARDFSGNAIGNENMYARFSIYEEGGSVDFEETQEITTDAFGVFTAIVGSQNQAQFYSLNWIEKSYHLKVEVSTNNSDFVKISDFPLLSVPYAHAAARAQNGVPPGSIMPFGGEVETSLPGGYLVCDGKLVNIDDYPELFNAIGTSWGGDGMNNFRLPDLRGYFLRGVSDDANNDPDKDSRISINDSNSGNNVGSYQNDELGSHKHDFSGNTNSNGVHDHDIKGKTASGIGSGNDGDAAIKNNDESTIYTKSTEDAGNHSHSFSGDTDLTGGNESRPKNAYVWYIIKY